MKKSLFIFSLFYIFLCSCNTIQNDSYNAITLVEGSQVLKRSVEMMQMRKIRKDFWNEFIPEKIHTKLSLEETLKIFEFFYSKIESKTIELSDQEQYFLEDLEYIEREMPCASPKKIPEMVTTDSTEMKLIRLSKTLQNLRKESYYNDVFFLTTIEGRDTTETIYHINKMVESQIKLSCEANKLINSVENLSFNDSLTIWLAHCNKKLNAELSKEFEIYADSLGYSDTENIDYCNAKLICDIQLLNLKMREMIYNGFSFCVTLNPRINVKLLQKKE